MNRIRKFILTALVSLGALGGQSAHAGVPVIDAANLVQAIEQVLAWDQQYNQMMSQINGITSQVNAITGSRNLGDILNNPALQGVVPSGLGTLYNDISRGGFANLSSAAKTLRDGTAIYKCEDQTGTFATNCQAALSMNSQQQADMQNVLQLVSQRTSQIQTLQNSINATADPIAVAQIQARIAAENTQVTNDVNRVAVAKTLGDLQKDQANQTLREQTLVQLKATAPATDFVYTPH